MARRFLVDISADRVVDLVTPVNDTDAANKLYVDLRAVPEGGTANQVLAKSSAADYHVDWVDNVGSGGPVSTTGVHIDMGTFPEPNNARIDGGAF